MPLDVAFHALEQEREVQRSLGVRLLALVSKHILIPARFDARQHTNTHVH